MSEPDGWRDSRCNSSGTILQTFTSLPESRVAARMRETLWRCARTRIRAMNEHSFTKPALFQLPSRECHTMTFLTAAHLQQGGSMKATRILAGLAVCLLLLAGLAAAQGVGASGDIKGTV